LNSFVSHYSVKARRIQLQLSVDQTKTETVSEVHLQVHTSVRTRH